MSTRTASPQLSEGKFFSRHVKLSPGIIEADTIEGFIFPALEARRARLINHRHCRRNETGLWTCIETGYCKLVPHEWPSSTDSSSDVAWKNSMHRHPGNRSVRSVSFDSSFPLLKILHGKSQFASQPNVWIFGGRNSPRNRLAVKPFGEKIDNYFVEDTEPRTVDSRYGFSRNAIESWQIALVYGPNEFWSSCLVRKLRSYTSVFVGLDPRSIESARSSLVLVCRTMKSTNCFRRKNISIRLISEHSR